MAATNRKDKKTKKTIAHYGNTTIQELLKDADPHQFHPLTILLVHDRLMKISVCISSFKEAIKGVGK